MPKTENKFLNGLLYVLRGIGSLLLWILKGIWNVLVFIAQPPDNWDTPPTYEEEEKQTLFQTKQWNVKLLLRLAATVIKADGKVQHKELYYVEKLISRDYNKRMTKAWVSVLQKELQKDHDLAKLCAKAHHRFTRSTKIQLLHFLCGIATRDGMLTENEYDVLKQIGMRLKIPFRTLKSILALFDYITEEDVKNRQENKQRKKKSSDWELKRAYVILEITVEATDKQIKKSFRKLAAIHHPDKVAHMGENFRKAANAKFKEILDAYELIKEARDMV